MIVLTVSKKTSVDGVTMMKPALLVMKTDLEETQTIVLIGSLEIVHLFVKSRMVTAKVALVRILVVSASPQETVKLVIPTVPSMDLVTIGDSPLAQLPVPIPPPEDVQLPLPLEEDQPAEEDQLVDEDLLAEEEQPLEEEEQPLEEEELLLEVPVQPQVPLEVALLEPLQWSHHLFALLFSLLLSQPSTFNSFSMFSILEKN